MSSAKDLSGRLPASSWNYRVLEFASIDGGTFRAIHEVHYSNGVPKGYSQTPAVVTWDTDEGEAAALLVLQRMQDALAKPVLTEEDFGKP